MRIRRLLCVLVFSLIFAACGGGQPSVTPAVAGAPQTTGATGALQTAGALGHSAGHLIVKGGMRPDERCPSQFVACVTVSSYQSAQLEICYSAGGSCGPSQPQYHWAWAFGNGKKNVKYFNGSFNPNPGNPADDTISEAYAVKPTHGKYKFEQSFCPTVSRSSPCIALFFIGIAVK